MKLENFDRCIDLRQDLEWQNKIVQSSQTLLLPIWKNKCLLNIEEGEAPDAIFIQLKKELIRLSQQNVFLGLQNNKPLLAIDLSNLTEEDLLTCFPSGKFIDLLEASSVLSTINGALMAYARGLIYWNNSTIYCGFCGSKTASSDFGHLRICKNNSCKKNHFPRLEPAIIVLLEQTSLNNTPNKCLLARHVRFSNYWTTLAGFVEYGEQIEEAVSREVFEEAGLKTEDVQYVSSQSWPFPSSLMIAFKAKTCEHEIIIDKNELVEAKWFTAQELKEGIESGSLLIPSKFSIANKLIYDFLKNNL